MIKMRQLKCEKGQGLVEYALILGLIFLAVVVAMTLVSGKINNMYTDIIASNINNAIK
ncbi:MAG: hypothetical protein Q4A47_02940 [Erysipelotrichaceae bacterium]|nr:hypothetical protein [Erysipelotrichaceae bacterium]